jgi:hypothetical protein
MIPPNESAIRCGPFARNAELRSRYTSYPGSAWERTSPKLCFETKRHSGFERHAAAVQSGAFCALIAIGAVKSLFWSE